MALTRRYTQQNLDDFFDGIGALLKRSEQRAHFALYAMGLLSPLERKSLEPIAELGSDGDPKVCQAMHNALTHFSSSSPWSDDAVRAFATHHALPHLLALEPLDVLIIDDTGFLKQGKHSAGVHRHRGQNHQLPGCSLADRRHTNGASAIGFSALLAPGMGGRLGPTKAGKDPRFDDVHGQGRHRIGHVDCSVETRASQGHGGRR